MSCQRHHNVPLESRRPFYLGYVVAQMEQREDFLGKARQERLSLKASEVGLIPLLVAIRLGALVASAGTKKKRS